MSLFEPILMTPYRLASRYVGISEVPGDVDHPLIQWWLRLAGLGANPHDETAWCGAFVNGVCWELWLPRPVIPARARSWLKVGSPVEESKAEIGFDVVVLSRGAVPQPGPDVVEAPGHVGFFSGWNDDSTMVNILGGNQGNKVSVAPYPAHRILAIRRLR